MQRGTVVGGRFEIESAAGTGAMGAVYRARDRHTGGTVALKILRRQAAEATARFHREARVLSELKHPGIVRHIAHGQVRGRMFLAMEWLSGEDLAKRLARSPLTIEETLRLAIRVADALAAVHARGIVHRDIKPGNLFLVDGDANKVKLVDFGIVHVEHNASGSTTRTGVILGTPGYMAPEQARGIKQIDGRTDVFSLGCVVYRCLTGTAPFQGEGLLAAVAKVLDDEAPRASGLRPDVPPALDELVSVMMNKHPEDRPADMAQVAAELESLASGSLEITAKHSHPSRAHELSREELRPVSLVLTTKLPTEGGDLEADLNRMRSALSSYGARLDVLPHGSPIVVFSGGAAATDQARQAARCALALRGMLHQQPVVVASGFAELRRGAVAGDVLDRGLAMLAELERTVRTSAITLIDDNTAALVDGRFGLTPTEEGVTLGPELRGVDGPRTLVPVDLPCVGREDELATILQWVRDVAAEGRARALIVAGPPSIGKSKLIREAIRRLEEGGLATVWATRAHPMLTGAAFAAVGQLVRGFAGIEREQPQELKRHLLSTRIAEITGAPETARRTSMFLGEFAGVPFADGQAIALGERPSRPMAMVSRDAPRVSKSLGELGGAPRNDHAAAELRAARQDPILMRDRMFAAWEELVRAQAARRPLCIVVEDLQWADQPSVRLLDATLQSEHPVIVVATARPDVFRRFPELWSAVGVSTMGLSELSRRGRMELLHAGLGASADPDAVAQLADSTGGNPFFVEELLRAEVDDRTESDADPEFPSPVVAMAATRLEVAGADGRRVLRAASIFGPRFRRDDVLALLGRSAQTRIDKWLERLAERELVRAPAPGGDPGEWGFPSAVLHRAAYSTLTKADRALGHRMAAEILARRGGADPDELARHHAAGGDLSRAASGFIKAAEQALAANAFDEVVEYAARAEAAVTEPEMRVRLNTMRADAHAWLGQNGEAVRWGTLAMEESEPGTEAWCDAAGVVAVASSRIGNAEQVTAIGEVLRGLGVGTAFYTSQLTATSRVAVSLFHVGRFELANALMDRIDARVDETAHHPMVVAWSNRARAVRALYAGDFAEYLHRSRRCVESFDLLGDRRYACGNRINLGFGYLTLGVYEEAEKALRQALADAVAVRAPNLATAARHNLGMALANLGQLEEAIEVERTAVTGYTVEGDRRLTGRARAYLAAILALAGALEDAEGEAEAAVTALSSDRSSRAHALAILSGIQLALGKYDQARRHAEDARALLDELGQLEEGESLIRLVYAQALRATGDEQASLAAISEARDALHRRADRVTDPELRVHFLESVPENHRTLTFADLWLAEVSELDPEDIMTTQS